MQSLDSIIHLFSWYNYTIGLWVSCATFLRNFWYITSLITSNLRLFLCNFGKNLLVDWTWLGWIRFHVGNVSYVVCLRLLVGLEWYDIPSWSQPDVVTNDAMVAWVWTWRNAAFVPSSYRPGNHCPSVCVVGIPHPFRAASWVACSWPHQIVFPLREAALVVVAARDCQYFLGRRLVLLSWMPNQFFCGTLERYQLFSKKPYIEVKVPIATNGRPRDIQLLGRELTEK